jgi:hypothetical protein
MGDGHTKIWAIGIQNMGDRYTNYGRRAYKMCMGDTAIGIQNMGDIHTKYIGQLI